MANLRPEIGMIKATRIVLEAIGGVALDPEVEFPDWAAADDLLRTSAGKMRCDDFTPIDFRVEWEDGHRYRGTIDIRSGHRDREDLLGGHIRSFLSVIGGIRKSEQLRAGMVQGAAGIAREP